VVLSSISYDAKGLLNESINDPNQYYSSRTQTVVLGLSGSTRQLPHLTYEKQPLREGNDVTVISFGAAGH
jgi:pyruvate/2-oxoglutarate/acetoin dehydrogenase E1 component